MYNFKKYISSFLEIFLDIIDRERERSFRTPEEGMRLNAKEGIVNQVCHDRSLYAGTGK